MWARPPDHLILQDHLGTANRQAPRHELVAREVVHAKVVRFDTACDEDREKIFLLSCGRRDRAEGDEDEEDA
jgi:hypothetical protein